MKLLTNKISLAALVVIVVSLGLSSPAVAESSLDEELEEYWATERDMTVIQDRLHERGGRFGGGLFLGFMSSEPFFYYFPVGAQATYFMSNSLGFEVGGSFMDLDFLNHHTELTEFLVERDSGAEEGQAGQFNPATDTSDRFLWRANATALWSPFYGKLAALQQKLIHFDLNAAAGLGAVGVERPNVSREEAISTVEPELVMGLGAHFYIFDAMTVRLDGRGYLHRGAELPTNEGSFFGRLNFPLEFQLGVSYLF